MSDRALVLVIVAGLATFAYFGFEVVSQLFPAHRAVGPPVEAVIVAVNRPSGYGRYTNTVVELPSGMRVSRGGAWGEVGDTVTVVVLARPRGSKDETWRGVATDGTRW